MAKRTSENGIKLISQREGVKLVGYYDSKHIPTIGVGHVILPGELYTVGGHITQAECNRLLKIDLGKAENCVNTVVKTPLTQNQFDALVSFVVNIGTGAFTKSTVARKLNRGDYFDAGKALMSWVKPIEITGRRRTEQKQFYTPDPKQSSAAKPAILTDDPANDVAVSDDSTSDTTALPTGQILPAVKPPIENPVALIDQPPVIEVPAVTASETDKAPQKVEPMVSIGNRVTAIWGSIGVTAVAIGTFLTSTPIGIAISIISAVAAISVGYLAINALRNNAKDKRDHETQLEKEKSDLQLIIMRETHAQQIQMAMLNSASRQDRNAVKIVEGPPPPPVEIPNSDSVEAKVV